MITATELLPYRTSSDDYGATERLKAQFARLRYERHPLYLTLQEFDDVLRWKLRGQYGRQAQRRKVNTEEVIQTVAATPGPPIPR